MATKMQKIKIKKIANDYYRIEGSQEIDKLRVAAVQLKKTFGDFVLNKQSDMTIDLLIKRLEIETFETSKVILFVGTVKTLNDKWKEYIKSITIYI